MSQERFYKYQFSKKRFEKVRLGAQILYLDSFRSLTDKSKFMVHA